MIWPKSILKDFELDIGPIEKEQKVKLLIFLFTNRSLSNITIETPSIKVSF